MFCIVTIQHPKGSLLLSSLQLTALSFVQFAVEDIVGAYGMINYVDARTVWMDDIVKKAQADDIAQACHFSPLTPKPKVQLIDVCKSRLLTCMMCQCMHCYMQVVIIAAGYCTRAYRLKLGNTAVCIANFSHQHSDLARAS